MCCHLWSEFLDSVLVIYKDLLAGKSPNTVIVPTSSCEEPLPPVAELEKDRNQQREGTETSALAECLDELCQRFPLRSG